MHLAKHMQFHGVDYIVVPKELWEEAKREVGYVNHTIAKEIYANMQAYDNSNEPVEIPNE